MHQSAIREQAWGFPTVTSNASARRMLEKVKEPSLKSDKFDLIIMFMNASPLLLMLVLPQAT